MAIGDLHNIFLEDRSIGSKDMLVDRQLDRRVDHSAPHPYRGEVVKQKITDQLA